MNTRFLSAFTLLMLAIATFVFTGCGGPKPRPRPDQTVSGRYGAEQSSNPDWISSEVYQGANANPNIGLTDRNAMSSFNADTSPDSRGRNTTGGVDNVLASVYFDFDRSAVKPSERTKLLDAQSYLSQNPSKRLLLEGHADWRGTTEYNLGLGERRARSVKDFLTNLGVQSSQIEVISKGDLEATENGSNAEMAEDRRVDLIPM